MSTDGLAGLIETPNPRNRRRQRQEDPSPLPLGPVPPPVFPVPTLGRPVEDSLSQQCLGNEPVVTVASMTAPPESFQYVPCSIPPSHHSCSWCT